MALSSAFQRTAFQDNAFQIRGGDVGAAIVIHRAGDERHAGPAFTKKRYRALLDAIEAEALARREATEIADASARQAAETALAGAREAIKAARAREDQLNAARARARLLAGALEALTGAQGLDEGMRAAGRISARAQEARARQLAATNDDEDALALLLAA